MDRKEFEHALAELSLPSVLLFEGEEEQLKQEAIVLLRRTLLPAGMEALNETVLESPETDRLIADAETQPFMADRRLVIVRDYPALTGRAEADEKLITWLPSVPETALLLFYCTASADLLKAAHHGSRSSTSESFLSTVSPAAVGSFCYGRL